MNKIRVRNKPIIDWTVHDTINWLKNVNLEDIIKNATNANLDGQRLLTISEERICSALDLGKYFNFYFQRNLTNQIKKTKIIDDEQTAKLIKEIKWLKQDQLPLHLITRDDIPIEYICPITQEIMLEPVTCSDGFTYEKRAITEWFLSGKYTSPMTNVVLENTDYVVNNDLRNEIHQFIYDDDNRDNDNE